MPTLENRDDSKKFTETTTGPDLRTKDNSSTVKSKGYRDLHTLDGSQSPLTPGLGDPIPSISPYTNKQNLKLETFFNSFHYVTLAILKLTMWTKLALNLERSVYLCFCLPRAKGEPPRSADFSL